MDSHIIHAPAFVCPANHRKLDAFRGKTRKALQELLGQPPFSNAPALNAQIVSEHDDGAFIRKKVRYGNESDDIVWAWLLIPRNVKTPAPAVICLPGSFMTPNWGKDAPAGLKGPLTPGHPEAYGADLAKAGFVALCPDYPCAGERTSPGLKPYDTSALDARFPDWTRMGLSTWDVTRAVDFVQTLDCVDGDRIGCVGWSQGGLTTLLGAAMDRRIAAAVSVCGWSPFRGQQAAHWTAPYNFPRLARFTDEGRALPFDLDHVAGLIAPRPFLNLNARSDHYFTNRDALASAECELAAHYTRLDAGDRFRAVYVQGDHAYSPEVAREVIAWFTRWLRPPTSQGDSE